uniref:Uncharacterized protein n=1 Tax=Bursaphelenchus xylophilus TaxID=6326 RepID=A0A1I7SKG9_BURXY
MNWEGGAPLPPESARGAAGISWVLTFFPVTGASNRSTQALRFMRGALWITLRFKASPVQTEVDMEPSPPELVRGASVNQSMKLRLLHTSSIAHQIKTTEESERQRIHGPSLENE